MLTIEEAIEKFEQELPEEVQLLCGEPEVMNPLEAIEKTYNVALSPLIIFVAIGELDIDNFDAFLENEFELDQETRKKLAADLNEKVFKPLLTSIDFINEHPEKEMSIEQEKNYIESAFKNTVLTEINRNPLLIDAVNRRIFFVLANDNNFQHHLEQALYENGEKLTEKNIIVDGQEMRPTIGNWIKDFIARYGSQAYDSVSISAFLINSDNAKILTQEERDKLSKVIKLYTNLKFFPESMPSDDGTDWQIIPYEKVAPTTEPIVAENESKSKPVPKPVPKPIILKPIPPKPAPTPVLTPTPAPSPVQSVTDDDADLLELRNMLLQYPAGSLERAAIEEEIHNLEKK